MDNVEKMQTLRRVFGYGTFRNGQEPVIDAILQGQDAMGVMPTGAGKSICYQLPALLLPGITLVVSPLISLMKDQVGALVQSGVRAAYLNSSLSPAQGRKALENARHGVYKIIYVAPERLLTEEFLSFAQDAQLSMVTVDEAHCVSQWGQDFRPSYLQIPDFIQRLSTRPVVSAFTATATAQVRQDIAELLGLVNPKVVCTGYDRKNLYYEIQRPKDKNRALLHLIKDFEGRSGIVYCSTRKAVEQVCGLLLENNYRSTRYHAGLTDSERMSNQDDFLYDRSPIMVATNAFGMGIDKSNVSFVIHYNMPKNLESYYQEAGRAGRDGEGASCVLLYGGQDVVTNQFLIEKGGDNEAMDEQTRAVVRGRELEKLRAMTFYCHTTDCLRQYVLRYFGENAENHCGNCFNCNHNFEEVEITTEAQKILSCVKRTGERYGVKIIVDVLRGSKGERLLQLGLDKQSTYGILNQVKEHRLREIIHFLVLRDCLRIVGEEYPTLRLGERAGAVLKGEECLTMKLPQEREERPKNTPQRAVAVDSELYENLRELRGRLAAEQGIPAYLIFSNATLTDICRKLPKSESEFLEVSGVGSVKVQRYGAIFLQAVGNYLSKKM